MSQQRRQTKEEGKRGVRGSEMRRDNRESISQKPLVLRSDLKVNSSYKENT